MTLPRVAAAASVRLLYLDWLRGLAVLLMISWHVIDSWTIRTGRDSAGFAVAIFFAGWAAPLFMFLAGVALPYAGAARMSRGADRRSAAWALQTRGWQVFLLAHVFRLQSFLLNPNASWNGLLKPDILNILGLSLVAAGFCWGRAQGTSASLIRWLLLPALIVVVVLAPLSPGWWWPTLLHPRLEAYIRPVANQGVFNLFPAAAYVFAGAFIGALMTSRPRDEPVVHRRLAVWGSALVLAGVGLAWTPVPDAVTFWTRHLPLVIGRIGTMMLALAIGWRALRDRPAAIWSPVVLLGQTSLFVYWVHVELVFSNITYPLHGSLPLAGSLVAYVVLTAAMIGLAAIWRGRRRGPWIPVHMRASPESVSPNLRAHPPAAEEAALSVRPGRAATNPA